MGLAYTKSIERDAAAYCQAALMKSAARSATIYTGAVVCTAGMIGCTENVSIS